MTPAETMALVGRAVAQFALVHPGVDVSAPCFVARNLGRGGIWQEACDRHGDRPLPFPVRRFFAAYNFSAKEYAAHEVNYVEVDDEAFIVRAVDYDNKTPYVHTYSTTLTLRDFDDRRGRGPGVEIHDVMRFMCPLTTVLIQLYYLPRRTVDRLTTEATQAEAEKRLRKGKKLPYFSYSIVRPNEYRLRDSVGAHPHGSPRQHQRIAHFRTLRSGKQIPVRDCVVGRVERGIVLQDYVL